MFQSCISIHRAIVCLLLIGSSTHLGAQEPSAESQKYALLVGCTRYPYVDRMPELYGPANDIPLWRKLLSAPSPSGFSFPDQNVQQLLGWGEDESNRPTRANIAQAFEALIARSAPGVQIVIVLSGHGTQQPIATSQDPFDPNNLEPDGLDEVFLPADSKEGSPAIENAIVDNEIAGWLDRMRAKGADVFVVFDCCHSGEMTRSADDVERNRFVDPAVLGVDAATLDQAINRASDMAQKPDGDTPPAAEEELATQSAGAELGSLVAFFAAQPFEPAPELPLPEGTAHVPENYYGLLSYTLIQTLTERRGPLSYRELYRLLGASYRARRGTRFPTPFAEGDLDREVLGAGQWPLRSEWALKREEDVLELNAGELQGITIGTVLGVYPVAAKFGDPLAVTGYLKVISTLPMSAVVMPIEFGGKPPIAEIPNHSRCEIASRSFGDLRVKLFVDDDPRLQSAWSQLDKEVSDMVELTPNENQAHWRLCVANAEEAVKLGLLGSTADQVLLLPGIGRSGSDTSQAVRSYFAAYSPSDVQSLEGELERDLPKLFRWQNLWRVLGGVTSMDGGESHGLLFESFILRDKQDTAGQPLDKGVLRSGDYVKFQLRNEGPQNLWVSLFYLDAIWGLGISTPATLNAAEA